MDGGTYSIIKGARKRQKRRAEVLRAAQSILPGAPDATCRIKGWTDSETMTTFWADRTPCWEACRCPSQIHDDCPAYTNRLLPCWEIEGTYGKLAMEGSRAMGQNTTVCQSCRVYKKYSEGYPVRHRLIGSGIDTHLNSAREAL